MIKDMTKAKNAEMTKSATLIRRVTLSSSKLTSLLIALGLALHLFSAAVATGQTTVRDLTAIEGSVPVRIVGYGIVVGLDGTGDRGNSSRNGDQTVQSIANILKRFGIEIPASALKTRNSAAVLVTAEVSPYLRTGARFDVTVSSLGDARSLKGGTLWMTPLVTDPNSRSLATAQGSLILSEGKSKDRYAVETSARIPNGGIVEERVSTESFASSSRLILKDPNIANASRIAEVINQAIAAGTATVEDPGAILLKLPDSIDRAATIVRIQELSIDAKTPSRIVIDSRDGSVAAGGDITISAATVSHSGVTITIGNGSGTTPRQQGEATPAVQLNAGVNAQRLAAALQAIQLEAQEIAAIFTALKEVGALQAEIIVK